MAEGLPFGIEHEQRTFLKKAIVGHYTRALDLYDNQKLTIKQSLETHMIGFAAPSLCFI